MGTIARGSKAGGGTNLNSGQTADPAEVNTDFNTVYTEINGELDDANIKTGELPGAKSFRFTEMSAPAAPSSNDILLYAVDRGITVLQAKESGGAVLPIGVQIVRKTADNAAVNNSTTLVNDDHLVAVLAASETIFFLAHIYHVGNGTADFKFSFTVPSGATVLWNAVGGLSYSDADAFEIRTPISVSGTGFGIGASTGNRTVTVLGLVRNSTTAGNLQFQFAQNTATVVDTKTLTDSFLMAWRV